MDTRFKKGIQELQNVSLNTSEKVLLFERILKAREQGSVATPVSAPASAPVQGPRKSYWNIYSFGSWVQHNSKLSAVIAVVIIFLGGNGLSQAALHTAPGDLLYSFKINISEPFQDTFKTTALSQAEWQAEKANRRLEEAETLAVRGTLDGPKQEELDMLLAKHTDTFSTVLAQVQPKSQEQADDISVSFQAGMNAHAKLLDTISNTAAKNPSQESAGIQIAQVARSNAEKFNKNSRQNANKMSKETVVAVARTAAPAASQVTAPPAATGVSVSADVTTMALSAPASSPTPTAAPVAPATTLMKSSEPTEVVSVTATAKLVATSTDQASTTKAYTLKKLKINKLLNNANSSLKRIRRSSQLRESIVDDTRNTLDEAQQSLIEADKLSASGDTEAAYDALLQSEKSATEATIFLKAGLNIK